MYVAKMENFIRLFLMGRYLKTPITFNKGEMVYKEYAAPKNLADNCNQALNAATKQYGFWFCDLIKK